MRPSGWWYGVAGVVGVGGVILAIFLLITSITDLWDKVDDFARVSAPGEDIVVIDDPGGYTIYHEFNGASDDFSFDPFIEVQVTDPDGQPVDLETYDAEVTYTTSDHEGVALYSFDADEAGEYTVEVGGDEGAVAIGPGIAGELVRRILTGLGIGFLSLVLCAVIAIVTGVRRGQDRRRRFVRQVPNQWPGAGPGAPYAPYGPAPGGPYAPGAPGPGGPYAPGAPGQSGPYAPGPQHPGPSGPFGPTPTQGPFDSGS